MLAKKIQIVLLSLLLTSAVFSLPVYAAKPTAKTFIRIGLINYENAEYSEAIDEFKQAIKLKPNYAEAHFHLANAYFGLRRYDEALDSYKKAVKLKPSYVDAHYSLGILATMLSEYDDAIKALKKVIKLDPQHSRACLSLGNAYSELENYEEAVKYYKKAVKLKPKDAGARYSLGVSYLKLDKQLISSARREYDVLIKLDKDLAKDLGDKIRKR
ncbi:MAG: tetratricopeptide repeat protein [Nitrospirota bacterium]